MGGSTFYDLTVNKASGKVVFSSLANITVNHTLTLTGGNIETAGRVLTVGPNALVFRSSGHVIGNLQMHLGAGDLSPTTFHIGSATDYTPLTVDLDGSGGTAGFLRATTVGSAHPNAATSGLNTSRDVDRYWRLTSFGAGLGTRTYKLRVEFLSADVPVGANPNLFEIRRWDGAAWNVPGGGSYTRTATSTQYSSFTSFSDFIVGEPANTAPNDPTALGQFKIGSATAIPVGGATNETSVVLKGTVSDPNGDQVALQVEVKTVGTAFDGTGLVESGAVGSGSTAGVTVSGLASGASYHWRTRAKDAVGATSNWVSFGGNADPADVDFTVDTTAPTSTITFPAAGGTYNATGSNAGCGTATGDICGSATDGSGSGVAKVELAIRRNSDGTYWNGTSFTSVSELFLQATGTTSWSYSFDSAQFPADGSYTVRVRSTDRAGNRESSPTATFSYDNTPPVVSNVSPRLVQVNTAFTVSAAVSDVLSGVASASYTIEAGTLGSGTAGPFGSATVTPSWSHGGVPAAGIYDLCVQGTDAAGNTSSACSLLTVYDPAGGSVSGGGWISVEAGHCYPTALCQGTSGKGQIALVARYLPGAYTPTGNTELHVGGFNFHSTSYEVLVIAGARAHYRGQGTINGAGIYNFAVWTTDGRPDQVRIQISDGSGALVFDNLPGGGLDLETASLPPLGGGTITIHTP